MEPLTTGALQRELERFTEQSLRQNVLVELRAQIRQDVQELWKAAQSLHMQQVGQCERSLNDSKNQSSHSCAGKDEVSESRKSAPIKPKLSSYIPPMVSQEAAKLVQIPSDEKKSTVICWQPTDDTVGSGKDADIVLPASSQDLRRLCSPRPEPRPSEATSNGFVLSQVPGSSTRSKSMTGMTKSMTIASPSERANRSRAQATSMRGFSKVASMVPQGHGPRSVALSRAYRCNKEASLFRQTLAWTAFILENSVSMFIVLNGVFMGVQTDYQARNMSEKVPVIFQVMEIIFCGVFTTELLFKLCAYHIRFFFMKDWAWNLFDSLLVSIQLIEVVSMLSVGGDSEGDSPLGNWSVLRLLRTLRVLRVLRLVRLLHFVSELANIIRSISNSLRPFLWSLLLLLMIIYIMAISITQIVFGARFDMKDQDAWSSSGKVLEQWWGSLPRSILTLYQSILGGVDWEDVVSPLEINIHPAMSIYFSLYIAFVILCMMNIITGTFVQSALKGAEAERGRDFWQATRAMFDDEDDEDIVAVVTLDQFNELLDDDDFQVQLNLIDISDAEARLLFKLLDPEEADAVPFDKLVANMLRLHKESKFLDIMKLMYLVKGQQRSLDDFVFQQNCSKAPGHSSWRSHPSHGSTDTASTRFGARELGSIVSASAHVGRQSKGVSFNTQEGGAKESNSGLKKTTVIIAPEDDDDESDDDCVVVGCSPSQAGTEPLTSEEGHNIARDTVVLDASDTPGEAGPIPPLHVPNVIHEQ